MEVVDIDGPSRMRGWQHGVQRREMIADVLDRFESQWPVALRRELIAATGFVATARQHAAHLLDELQGIAEGSGVAFERILALNLMDEMWGLAASGLVHCSALGVRGDGRHPTVLAQNMDLPACYDGAQTLLRIRSSDGAPDILTLTVAGMLGLCGVNDQGVGIAVTSIPQLFASPTGLPVSFLIRRLLEQVSAADAVAMCRCLPHAVGQYYLIGGLDTVSGLEASAHVVVDVLPDQPGRVCHTNHALVSGDRAWAADPEVDLMLSNSGPRLDCLRRLLQDTGTPTATDVQRVLASREGPISREIGDPDTGFTFGAVVMELGAQPVLHVAPGPPSQVSFKTHQFT